MQRNPLGSKTVEFEITASELNIGAYKNYDLTSLGINSQNYYLSGVAIAYSSYYIMYGSILFLDHAADKKVIPYIQNSTLVVFVDSGITFPAGAKITVYMEPI